MSSDQPIIIKRKKVAGHGHHGGAWKVAYADFVTAMMAFFLLLWLLATASPEEKDAIQGYFQDPMGSPIGAGGGMNAPGVGMTGDGGANLGAISLNNPLTQPEKNDDPLALEKSDDAELQAELAKREQQDLEELEQSLTEELKSESSPLIKLNDQIVIDQTGIGLRIQIFDKKNRPMFELGSEELEVYAEEVLLALAPHLNTVPNYLSVDGHTDALPYAGSNGYSNWELSAARANSARRALVDGGVGDAKILNVQGFGSSIPRVAENPDAAENRRIVIMVLKDEYAKALGAGTSMRAEEFIDATLPAPEAIEPVTMEPTVPTEIHLDADGNPIIVEMRTEVIAEQPAEADAAPVEDDMDTAADEAQTVDIIPEQPISNAPPQAEQADTQ